jgi:molecular chaperone GrpE
MSTKDEAEKHGTPSEPDELEACRRERDEYLNGWKRARADLINYQKDEMRRFEEVVRFGTVAMVEDMLPVLDSLDLAAASAEGGAPHEGIAMIRAQLWDILKKRGLEKIEAPPGTAFDPSVHESVGEAESAHPPGTVAEAAESGYALHGRVIRAVKVKVSKQ